MAYGRQVLYKFSSLQNVLAEEKTQFVHMHNQTWCKYVTYLLSVF